MEKETVLNRLIALRAWMRTADVRAFVVRDVTNIAWLTGFEEVFDDERAHTLVVTEDRAALLTDSRYAAACEVAARRLGNLFAVEAAAGVSVPRFIELSLARQDAAAAGIRARRGLGAGAGADVRAFAIEDDIILAEFRALEKLEAVQAAAPKETHHVVRGLRAVKTEDELIRLQRAQDITDAAFEHIKSYVQPGMTERDVQIELNDFMLWAGAERPAFATIVAAGANAAKPHAVAGNTKLDSGQVLLLDFGAKFQGYCADMTRCIFLGQPTPAMRRMYDTVVSVNEAILAALKPGVTGAAMQAAAERMLAEAGFAGKMGHGLGHGVGMDVHEEPCLNNRNTEPLVVGNVVTVEPGIYLPAGLKETVTLPTGGSTEITLLPPMGIRVEDFGVITDEGFRVFTKSSHDIVIL